MDPDSTDPVVTERRFLDGLASAAGLDRDVLDRPGTTVVADEDRVGSGAVACYRTATHLVALTDPAVVERVAVLASADTLSDDQVGERLAATGFGLVATVVSNLLAGPPTPPPDLAPGLVHRWLPGDAPTTVEAVRAFADRCDPDEVEAAALDELDDYDEAAINVVCPADGDRDDHDDRPHILAYASASEWFWDPVLADIGVLVDADHRRRGLARFVVANTVARLLADGRIPFYRHEATNQGSRATAASLGFRPVATLQYFVAEEP